jgi:rare lipoprotein A
VLSSAIANKFTIRYLPGKDRLNLSIPQSVYESMLIFTIQIFDSMRKFLFSVILAVISSIAMGQVQSGKASFYADKFEGRPTASGEKYKHSKLTAAHKTLPFGTKVKVTNTANNQSVEVTINDRGPYVDGRIIDLSKSAAEKLGFVNLGLADVMIEVIDAGDGKTSDTSRPIGNVEIDEKEFYDFEIERKTPTGFGVQIATYQELVNLMRLTDNLKKSYQKKVTVQVKVINGVKYYGLILGQFPSRSKAEDFREQVRKKFPDAFIIEFNRL